MSGHGQGHESDLLVNAGSGLRLSFGVRALTEMEIRCVKGMYRLKLVSSENNSGFKVARYPVFSRSTNLESKLIVLFVLLKF